MSRKPLRVVAQDEPAAPRKPLTVREAAESGSHRDLLVSLRTRIAQDIDDVNTPARDLAALTRRLQEIAKEIAAIDSHNERDEVGSAAEVPDEEWAAT